MALINQVAPPRIRTWHKKAHVSMTASTFFLFAQPPVLCRKFATVRIQAVRHAYPPKRTCQVQFLWLFGGLSASSEGQNSSETNSTTSGTAAKPASTVTGFSDSFKWAIFEIELSRRLGWRNESGLPLDSERRSAKPSKSQTNRPDTVPGAGTNETDDQANVQNQCAAAGDCSISCHYDLIEHAITLATTLLITFVGRACMKALCQRRTTNDLTDLAFPT